MRTIQSIFTLFDLYLSHPLPKRASFTRRIPSTVSSVPGSIDLLFYTPPSYTKSPTKSTEKHPLLINFHGGGFTIGHAYDDARWATSVTTSTNAVVVSVEYRLAPSYPFPIGIEDCVSAILWLWSHAEELNLDISKTSFSGFSAGGNFCYTVSIRLNEELDRLKKEGKLESGLEKGKVVSLVVFYGGTDQTLSRAEKDASNPNLIPVIPPFLFKLFDESSLALKPDLSSPLLSPGIVSDEVLKNGLPGRVVMIICSGDQLLAESERFRERLNGLGKKVEGHVVEGEGHAWDKEPTWKKGDKKRDYAYGFAVKSLLDAWS
ncbi:alpha/beta-hydrolase [Acephala macrosclerotiorum]|nr:alpha/beta-hydrolase [Acephala macrosclerotiorum]